MKGIGAGNVSLLLVGITAAFGGRIYLVAVLVLAGVALLEMSREAGATGPRPIVAAAAVAGLGTPLRASLQPDNALQAMPAMVVAMVLAAFTLMIMTGRRTSATATMGATMLSGLLVGLGAGALVGLQATQGGWPWVVAVVAVAAATTVATDTGRRPLLAGPRSLRTLILALATAPAVYLLVVTISS